MLAIVSSFTAVTADEAGALVSLVLEVEAFIVKSNQFKTTQ